MKHILDSDFRYRPSFDTDVRKTFEKIRRQQSLQQAREREEAKDKPVVRVKVLQLDQLKKATAT
ncbi:MAG TPA: hypothetical protein VF110_06380 [Burkholderiales bacterium]